MPSNSVQESLFKSASLLAQVYRILPSIGKLQAQLDSLCAFEQQLFVGPLVAPTHWRIDEIVY